MVSLDGCIRGRTVVGQYLPGYPSDQSLGMTPEVDDDTTMSPISA